jgi:uncharacterized iron-regulated membrane protein
MLRQAFVWLHRYVGLATALFLIIEGVTGSLLAFEGEIGNALDPRLVATKPSPDARKLALAELALLAEALEPTEHVAYFAEYSDARATMRMWGRKNPETGGRYPDVPFHVVLNPWTGERLAEKEPETAMARFLAAVMPFARDLHVALTFGATGEYVLLAVALFWTIDCFVGFYLTLPITLEKFWRRWKPAWLVKWRGGFYRVNFDLHRAGGLWFWIMLLMFAWSSVLLVDRIGVYGWVMARISDYQGDEASLATFFADRASDAPFKLDWPEAQASGEKLMGEKAAREGFKALGPQSLNRFEEPRLYNYSALTDRAFPQERTVTVFFDADTGGLRENETEGAPAHWGDALTFWLRALHMARDPIDHVLYRVLIVVVGLAVAMLSATGVYIWWKKRRARIHHLSRPPVSRMVQGRPDATFIPQRDA